LLLSYKDKNKILFLEIKKMPTVSRPWAFGCVWVAFYRELALIWVIFADTQVRPFKRRWSDMGLFGVITRDTPNGRSMQARG
jgi:hypothetical protein